MDHPSPHQLLLQVTLSAEESPELFQALVHIRDPKRRIGRFRDLATRGLIFTLGGFALAPALREAVPGAASSSMSTLPSKGVMDGLTDWTES